MGGVLVVHFVSGSNLRLAGIDAQKLGPGDRTSNGMIEIQTPGAATAKIWINPEQIAYVEEYETPDAAARQGPRTT